MDNIYSLAKQVRYYNKGTSIFNECLSATTSGGKGHVTGVIRSPEKVMQVPAPSTNKPIKEAVKRCIFS